MYWPEDVYGQINLPSAEELQRGIICVKSTSFGLNKPYNKLESHYFVPGSMRSTTFASLKPSTVGDKILGWSLYGSHASSQTPVDSPLPTLHLAPLKKKDFTTYVRTFCSFFFLNVVSFFFFFWISRFFFSFFLLYPKTLFGKLWTNNLLFFVFFIEYESGLDEELEKD